MPKNKLKNNKYHVNIARAMLRELNKLQEQVDLAEPDEEDLADDHEDWKWSVNTYALLINQVAGNINPHPADLHSDCWMCNTDDDGRYPRVELRYKAKRGGVMKKISKKRKASRLVFALYNPAMIPELIEYCKDEREWVVSHLCDQVKCVNPNHLRWETHKRNVQRRECHKKGRCQRNHGAGVEDCVGF